MSKGNAPAYPTILTGQWAGTGSNAVFAPDCTEGFTKREAYALAAMQGILAKWGLEERGEHLAEMAFQVADYMLAESEKPHD